MPKMVPIQRTEKKAHRPRNWSVVRPLSMNWLMLSLWVCLVSLVGGFHLRFHVFTCGQVVEKREGEGRGFELAEMNQCAR